MGESSSRMTPLAKQCFAILGVSLGMMSTSQIMSFTSVMLPQLRSVQDIDDEQESWIASITGISFFLGLIITPPLMDRYGRRTINLLRAGILSITWFAILLTTDVFAILLIRFIQGFCIGFAAIVVPVLIGEYSSPKYRGAFLTTISLAISLGVLCIHVIGRLFTWQIAAVVCSITAFVNTIIAIFSPESPSYLAAQGEYNECRRAFYWLRHPEEKEEVEKMIRAHMTKLQGRTTKGLIITLHNKIINFFRIWMKKEFYKPIVIIFHMHVINEWSAATIFDAYTSDIFHMFVGQNVNVSLMIISTDILRAISSICIVVFIRRFRRRVMLLATISFNILSYIMMTVYLYLKANHLLTFDHPLIGEILIHFHVFTFSIGNLALPNILAGEIFALEYRGLSNMLAQMFFCVNFIISAKTALNMASSMGLHGMFMVYAGMVSYGLLVTWFLLPETKDKTLQEIEEEFRGKLMPIENTDAAVTDRLMPNENKLLLK